MINISLLIIKAYLKLILQKLLVLSFLPLYTIERFNGDVLDLIYICGVLTYNFWGLRTCQMGQFYYGLRKYCEN